MSNQAAANYLRTKVLTATPEQLQMMLYDGAVRFAEQGKLALQSKTYDQSFEALTRAQQIVLELQCGLKKDLAPDLCNNLAGLYNFVYRKLVDANTKHDLGALDEALQILRYQRETWALLMQKLAASKAAVASRKIDFPSPDARMEASFSFQG
ncbi:MAG: flagellar export chaperone FliS [Tepidisphaeraceae bacterium]